MPLDDRRTSSRYLPLILDTMASPALSVGPEEPGSMRVERGEIFPLALLGADPDVLATAAAPLVAASDPRGAAVVDASGHRRGHYRPLLVYCWLRAYETANGRSATAATAATWAAPLARRCEALGADGALPAAPDGWLPAARGEAIAGAAWAALTVSVGGALLGRAAWRAGAADVFRRLVAAQAPEGPFLSAAASDNPETLWFHELVLLHAAAGYAVQTGDADVAAAVGRHAEWVQRETQPDHATSQPWGLQAFAWNPRTRPTADALLHAVRVQQPGGAGGVSLMLLADALYCLRRIGHPPGGGGDG